jgi:hypothetical protein
MMKTLGTFVLLASLPLSLVGQEGVGFHEAQFERRADWVPFALRGETVWVNPDQSVSITSAAYAQLGWRGAPSSVIESPVQPYLELQFTETDRRRIAALTTRIAGQRMAVLHHGVLLAAPLVSKPIVEGRVSILGIVDAAMAQEVVAGLEAKPPKLN